MLRPDLVRNMKMLNEGVELHDNAVSNYRHYVQKSGGGLCGCQFWKPL